MHGLEPHRQDYSQIGNKKDVFTWWPLTKKEKQPHQHLMMKVGLNFKSGRVFEQDQAQNIIKDINLFKRK